MTLLRSIDNLSELIYQTERIAYNDSILYEHIQSGTIDQYYKQILDQLAADLMLIPVRSPDLSSIDPDDVTDAVTELINIVSLMFDKLSTDVSNDLHHSIELLPTDDLRSACLLQQLNRLH